MASVLVGNQRYKYVLLVHPTVAIQKLYYGKKVPQQGHDTFWARQLETGDVHFESRRWAKKSQKGSKSPPDSHNLHSTTRSTSAGN